MAEAYNKKFLTLRTIDRLLDEHQKNADLYAILFDKKIKLLDAIKSGKIDAMKYAAICKKLLNEEPSEDIKAFIDMQLTMLMEGDQQQWFNDILEETKEELGSQQRLFQKYSKKQTIIPSKQPPPTQQPNLQKKVSTSNSTIMIDKIFSLKLLDSMMETASSEMFLKLFAQKQKLIGFMEQRKLNDKVYLGGIKKMLQEGASFGLGEDEMFTVQMEFDLLGDLHDGNVEEWFKDVVDETGQCYESQMQKFNKLKSGGGGSSMKKKKSEQVVIQQTRRESVPQPKKMTQTLTRHSNQPIKQSNYICFKYLQNNLQENMNNPQKFCQLFKQKQDLITMMQNGKLTAQSYRNNLTKLLKQSKNEQEKQAAQTQLDFHDLTGDVDQFFESTVEEMGEKYEEQKQLYEKLSKKSGSSTSNPKKLQKGVSELYDEMKNNKKQLPKPNVSDIVSFKVIVQFLTVYQKDYDYCLQLKTKGKKLYALVQQKKLGPNQYKQFLITKLSSLQSNPTNKPLLSLLKSELKQYQNSSNIGKLFKNSVKEYLDKVKVNLGKRRSFDDEFQVDQHMINEVAVEIQIEFLIRKLAKYESMLAYFRNNGLEEKYQGFKKEYVGIKEDVLQVCQQLKSGYLTTKEQNKEKQSGKHINLREYVQTHLPDITFGMFHRTPKSEYIEKIDEIIAGLKMSAKQYLQYTKKIKKGSNKNNIEQANKYKESIIAEIEYLQVLKNKNFVPLPQVEINQQDMYNLDLNKHLSENDLQIIINNVDGIPSNECILKIYMINMKQYRFKANVKNGHNNIKTIITVPPQKMQQIIKGTDHKYLAFKFNSKGWFGQSTIDQVAIQLTFIKSNVMEETVVTHDGKIHVNFTARVYKPKKPLITKVKIVRIKKKYEEYKHSRLVQNQFLKSLMPFQNPSKSEIAS